MLRTKAGFGMQRLPLALSTLSIFALTACPGGDGGNSIFEQDPWRSAWETVIDGAVLPGECPLGTTGCECGGGMSCDDGSCAPTTEGDFCLSGSVPNGGKGGQCDNGTCQPGLICAPLEADPSVQACVDPPNDEVRSLYIGGRAIEDNFVNRGDIEVFFNGPEDKITVQMRKFTFAPDEATAQANWDRLIPWAYSGSVVPPGPDIIDDDCSLAFRDGCEIRVWYDGLTQPVRDGADIRVILPPSYMGNLDIITEDNVEEDQYPDRGDVTVSGLRGTADIELDSGNVQIDLAADVLEAPACGAEAVKACEDYVDPETMEPAPWALQCGCTDFGKVRVESRGERAANVTVDMPGDLWATARMENAQPGLTKDSDPLCTAIAECGGIDDCEDLNFDPAFPWKRDVEFNDPGDTAVEGVGYGFDLTSEACQNVAFASEPDDWGSEPDVETRGNLKICSGCLDIPAP